MRTLLIVVAVLIVLTGGLYTFREPLMNAVFERLTADMFVSTDADTYDPGLAIGERFPDIRARFNGGEVVDISQFMGERGMILVANRSVDW